MGEFQSTDLLADGAGERPFFMSKQFAFEQTGRNGSTVEFDKRAVLTLAVVVNSARHQLLARPRVAQQQHGRIAGCDRLHQFQNLLQGWTVSNNVIKIQLAANLFFEIELFLCQFVFEFRDLAVGERIFNGQRDLACYLRKKFRIVLAEGIFFLPAKTQYTNCTSTIDQRGNTEGLESFTECDLIILGTKLGWVKLVHNDRLERFKSSPTNPVLRSDQLLMQETPTVREVQRVNPKLSAFQIQ